MFETDIFTYQFVNRILMVLNCGINCQPLTVVPGRKLAKGRVFEAAIVQIAHKTFFVEF